MTFGKVAVGGAAVLALALGSCGGGPPPPQFVCPPPLTVQDEVQLLLVTCTSAGALVRSGQHTVGLVVALTVLLTQSVVVLRQRA